jgi:hypothetical protein
MRNAVALTAMLLILGLSGLGDGIVLCVGDDGHVAIEAVGLEGCAEGDESTTSPVPSFAPSSSSSHCGPCIDVALTSSAVAEGAKSAKRATATVAQIPSAVVRSPIPHLRASISYRNPSPFVSEKPHTIVIRC